MSKKKLIAIIIPLIVIFVATFFVFRPEGRVMSISGTIIDISAPSKTIYIKEESGISRDIVLTKETLIFDEDKIPISITDLERNFSVKIKGVSLDEGSFLASEIIISIAPSLVISSPEPGDIFGESFILSGRIRGNNKTIHFRLRSSDGTIILEDSVIAPENRDPEAFSPFNKTIFLIQSEAEINADLEIFTSLKNNGEEKNKFIYPITIGAKRRNVKVFFGDADETSVDCSIVFSLERNISYKDDKMETAVKELLLGPTEEEEALGYFSSIPLGTKLNSVVFSSGTVTVDFNERLSEGSGGSCRVISIISQITETLKQFYEVQSVIISVNGETRGILEP